MEDEQKKEELVDIDPILGVSIQDFVSRYLAKIQDWLEIVSKLNISNDQSEHSDNHLLKIKIYYDLFSPVMPFLDEKSQIKLTELKQWLDRYPW